ncbi:MAG: hypothetical protein PVJ53_10825 [Desulfobacterales bacterium]|jgi:hypothetical protein
MNRRHLDDVIETIGNSYREDIQNDSRFYVEVNIGEQAKAMGYGDIQQKFGDAFAVVPLRRAVPGMKVRIDGRTFVNYAQFESGIAVPGYVARDAKLPYKTFIPNDSMILNCA